LQLRDTPAQRRFREELRGWLRDVLPTLDPQPSQEDWPARRAYDSHWQALLHHAGYAGLNRPQEDGVAPRMSG
jgi:hypothetical protein